MSAAGEAPEEGRYKVPALLVLSEIASSLSTEATLDELVSRYLSTMVRVAGALAGSVRLLTPDGRQLRLVSSVGLPPEMVERERLVPRDCGVCGESIDGARATWSGEPRVCRGMNPGAFVPGCGEVIAVPLQHRGEVHGVYNLFLAQGRRLSDDVRLLFGAISEHLGVALENAQLARENTRATLVNERQLLANEVHDSVAQTLAYTRMRAAALREAQKNGDPALAERYLAEMEDAIEAAYGELRELIGRFRQPMDPRGLVAALQAALDAFAGAARRARASRCAAPSRSLAPRRRCTCSTSCRKRWRTCRSTRARRPCACRSSSPTAPAACASRTTAPASPPAAPTATSTSGWRSCASAPSASAASCGVESPPGGGARLTLSFPARGE